MLSNDVVYTGSDYIMLNSEVVHAGPGCTTLVTIDNEKEGRSYLAGDKDLPSLKVTPVNEEKIKLADGVITIQLGKKSYSPVLLIVMNDGSSVTLLSNSRVVTSNEIVYVSKLAGKLLQNPLLPVMHKKMSSAYANGVYYINGAKINDGCYAIFFGNASKDRIPDDFKPDLQSPILGLELSNWLEGVIDGAGEIKSCRVCISNRPYTQLNFIASVAKCFGLKISLERDSLPPPFDQYYTLTIFGNLRKFSIFDQPSDSFDTDVIDVIGQSMVIGVHNISAYAQTIEVTSEDYTKVPTRDCIYVI